MTLSLRTHIVLAGLLWSAFLLAAPPAANAGVILGPPMYMGLSSRLVGWWSFDGKDIAGNVAYDRSGQGNNGTLTNEPTKSLGKIGQALEANAGDEYVDVGDPASLDFGTGDFTVSFWARVDGFVNQGSSDNAMLGDKRLASPNSGGYVFGFDSTVLPYIGVGDGTSDVFVTAATNIQGAWHHIAGRRVGGQTIQLFIDAVKEGTDATLSTGRYRCAKCYFFCRSFRISFSTFRRQIG